ncbi:unnamed protein product, partial [Eretmochelys imbricata]
NILKNDGNAVDAAMAIAAALNVTELCGTGVGGAASVSIMMQTQSRCKVSMEEFPGYKLQLFQELAKSGKKSFYEGCVAEVIIETVQRNGGLMDLEDLKSHVTDE